MNVTPLRLEIFTEETVLMRDETSHYTPHSKMFENCLFHG